MYTTVFMDDKIRSLYNNVSKRTSDFYSRIRKKEFKDYGLSHRLGQVAISNDFIDSLINNQMLIKEAGVGVGKSFSYLIPVLYLIDEFKKNNRKLGPVFISTSSISLQNQLMKDIEFLKSIMNLDYNVTANVALGMNNYACLKRIENVISEGRIYIGEDETLKKVINEIKINNTALFSSVETTIKPYLENKIKAVSRGECYSCCQAGCQLPSELKKLQNSDIIIVNHQLLSRYAIDNEDLLVDASVIVTDEGHNLEDAIRTVMSEEISIENLYHIIDKTHLDKDSPLVKDLTKKFRDLFMIVKYQAERSNKTFGALDKYSYYDNLPINLKDERIKAATMDLLKYMKAFRSYIVKNKLLTLKRLEKFDEHIDFIESLSRNNNYIFSVETYEKKGSKNGVVYKDKWVKIKRTPKNINSVTRKIFKNKGAMITSATIPENIISDLGIQGPVAFANSIPSPFKYSENAVYYDYSDGMMEPRVGHIKINYQKYTDDLAYRIADSIVASNGRSLVLFTNKEDTNVVFRKVNMLLEDAKTRNPELDIPLFLQTDKNKDTIAVEFRDNNKSVLFSYGFWEGLDVPHDSLSQVVVTRLPFPVMTPNLNHKTESCSSTNEAMNDYYIPEMIKTLRQAFGRLIRTVDDKGVIINLDSRSKIYANAIDYALDKSCPGIIKSTSLKEVDTMFNKIDGQPKSTPRTRILSK